MSPVPAALTCVPVTGIGEIRQGDDLGEMLHAAARLTDGDILVVTSKVVSKAEGRVVASERDTALAEETDRVVARRGGATIVRTRHGLVLAAAGVDASNTEPGTVVLLPTDPDTSARALRERIGSHGGPNVAVVVTDTFGRAWRNGQTDVAIGAAGLDVLHDYAGEPDGYGNLLEVTAPAVADEIAAAADLVKGKLARFPAAVLRGLAHLVAPAGDHRAGARELVRDEAHDMFGYGAREAVLRALRHDPRDLRGFGGPASCPELVAALRAFCPEAVVRVPEGDAEADQASDRVDVLLPGASGDAAQRALGGREATLVALAFSMGWVRQHAPAGGSGDVLLRLSGTTP